MNTKDAISNQRIISIPKNQSTGACPIFWHIRHWVARIYSERKANDDARITATPSHIRANRYALPDLFPARDCRATILP